MNFQSFIIKCDVISYGLLHKCCLSCWESSLCISFGLIFPWKDAGFHQFLFCIYWYDYGSSFFLHFINVVCHTDGCWNVEPSLPSWNASHWIMEHTPFICCGLWFADVLMRIFVSLFIRHIGMYFYFIFMSLTVNNE